jgi:hypothetical protein
MRIIETKAYTFDELSDDAKENAVNNLREINVEHDWWDCTYETFRELGIRIEHFDLGRRSEIGIDLIETHHEVAINIIGTFGENGLKANAEYFIEQRDKLVKELGEGDEVAGYSVKEGNEEEFDERVETIEGYYFNGLKRDILHWLRCEFEYLMSDEAIIDTIEANEYEFTKEGKLI